MSDQHTQLVFNKPFRAGFISALVVIIFIALSCMTELPQLADIDIEEWSSDRNACQGYRQSVVKALDAQRSKLLALSANEITAILGKPDQIELYKRNQKLFFYNLNPGPTCGTKNENSRTLRLMIRLNAMERAKEIIITP